MKIRKILALILALLMVLSLAACGGKDDTPTETPDNAAGTKDEDTAKTDAPDAATADASDWAIYWYLCGSDLESQNGFATGDIGELMEVQLPENVKVVIETGGSTQWHNDFVDASKLQRFVYDSNGLQLVDEQPSASMGDAQTLADFLAFSKTNYPGEKTAVVFWNHGGGSVTGVAFDEIYGNDSLRLDELYAAFSSVFEVSAENQPLELIGFDTCLMATVDVASTFSDIAKYMVASEECEPANGWLYSKWVGALAENTEMDGAEIGKIICDSYYEGCQAVGTEQSTTLSLVDLSRIAPLMEAYGSFGSECLAAACQDPSFFSQFARAAFQSENYGGNTKEQGYSNMVDLGDLARHSSVMTGSSPAVLDALKNCVLYSVNGPYKAEASGLSCYFSYNGDAEDFAGFAAQGAEPSFKYYYAYGLTGELDESGMEYVKNLDISELPEVKNLASMGWDGAALDVNDEGTSFMTLGPDAENILAGIGFQLYYMNEESDSMMLLGTDNDMNADWENGVFSDNFRGVWGAIDGCLVYMELSNEGDGYNLYSVPVLLNGEEYNLQVVYDFTEESWIILGAWQGMDENGMADKEMRLLAEGDEITTIWKLASISGDDDFENYVSDVITVNANTAFSELPLPDGTYRMVFEMWDAMGNYAYSDPVQFDCAGGEITTTVFED